jgi:small GTP-binding protein
MRGTGLGDFMRTTKRFEVLVILLVVLLVLWSVVAVLNTLISVYDRLAWMSRWVAGGATIALAMAAVLAIYVTARLLWKMGRDGPSSKRPEVPTDLIEAANLQAEQVEKMLPTVADPEARANLERELQRLREARAHRRFHVVVFGTGSAGKTSLINAVLGREVGAVEATVGTTRHGEEHTHLVEGVDGTLALTDTPGISEIGDGGAMREAEARGLAARADLLLFVVDHDLTRSEFDPLAALARQGKRSIVAFNKIDRFPDEDRAAIVKSLRERLRGVVPPEDVVEVAAAPRPTVVRMKHDDGTVETVLEAVPPELGALGSRIAAVLGRDGDLLRAGNHLLWAHLIADDVRAQLTRERRAKAEAVIDKFQWMIAGSVALNPLPAVELLLTGTGQFQMISEIAGAYGVELNMGHAQKIGGQLAATMIKLGIVEAATSLIAGFFKASVVGYAVGGGIQGVTMAYLTHISGHAVADFFERGQSWGDGGMQGELIRVFDLNSRAEFLREFVGQAVQKVAAKTGLTKAGAR